MTIDSRLGSQGLYLDKDGLLKILEEQDRQTGFVPDRSITPERLQEMMLAEGVRPEDCIACREVIRMREE